MKKNKSEIITFKVDEELSEALKDVDNRSEFIRVAVADALGASCPLCQGVGVLSPSQKKQWDNFVADNGIGRCEECHELRPICSHSAKSEDN